jgi:NAD(P)-dependent dehydrogenase (short-subunit alcohol dehydrogenase family)
MNIRKEILRSREDWDQVLTTNLKGVLLPGRRRHTSSREYGKVVNISSISSF